MGFEVLNVILGNVRSRAGWVCDHGLCCVSPCGSGQRGSSVGVHEPLGLLCRAWLLSSHRSGAFEVLALDGVSTGILQFHTAQESTDWLRAVSANIGDLTLQTVSRLPMTFCFSI